MKSLNSVTTHLLFAGFFSFSVFTSFFLGSASNAQDQKIDFAHQIVPILKKHCVKCHTNGTYKGGLSLDNRNTLLKSGIVEPGDSAGSELLSRITSTDKDERMPPEGERLSEKEIQQIKKWIDDGLVWESGFTFKKQTWKAPILPRKPELPDVDQNPIDYLVGQYFSKRKIEWPRPVDDATFLRRVSLDLIGLLPYATELNAFGNEVSTSKREQVVTNLLSRNRDYADHWLTFWNDHLRNDYAGTGFIDGGRKQITGWLYRALYNNLPYDRFARELIAPSPDSEGFIHGIKWRGNVNASQVRELQFAQNISQVFLGENLKCASCHDSFINEWKLEDAYGLASVLSDKPLEMYRCDKATGKTMSPKFLWPELGKIDEKLNQKDRLTQVADLVTKKENGRFARTIVNRIWKRMMGRGLVEPVDVMGNRPWDEDILDYLAVHLQENGFDLKQTMKLIANSKIYQSTCRPQESADESDFVFRGPLARRMTAEQFLDSVWQVTGGGPAGAKGPIPVLSATAPKTKGKTQAVHSKWIWNQPNSMAAPGNTEVEFRGQVMLQKQPGRVSFVMTCDNEYTLYVNGRKVKNDTNWNTIELIEAAEFFRVGENAIRIVGKNHTASPNPAALYASMFIDQKPAPLKLVTTVGDKEIEAPAVTHPQVWSNADPSLISNIQSKEQQAVSSSLQGRPQNRAAHFVADSLMRSLGRPNREQIVTTRDDQLSTLQALDLSNGEVFAKIVDDGANRILQRLKTREEIIQHVYTTAFSRSPTADETSVLVDILGETPSRQSVADLIWTVVMLPEFQHVR